MEVRYFDLLPESGMEYRLLLTRTQLQWSLSIQETHVAMSTLLSIWPRQVLTQPVVESIKSYLDISADPAAFIQGAIPQLIENTKEEIFEKIVDVLRQTTDICWEKVKGISCITCPSKPEGTMFVVVKLDLSYLHGIKHDMDFCCKLAKEELVVLLPGCVMGYKNWLRITFAIEPSSLEDGIDRLKSCFQIRSAGAA
uniref:Aminotransferase class I/classII large domain-containing protein n=1 Tax=Oryza punctata TaxID=4537 RepID=A0A0E0MGA6_ORYPU